MMPEELDLITKLREHITHEYNELATASAGGSPLLGLDEGRDSTYALAQYARLVGGTQAYKHVLTMIGELLENREKAMEGSN